MRRRASALFATACVAATSFGLQPPLWASAEDSERASLRAELGVEYDTNAQRTELVGNTNPPIIASPLARGVITGQLSDRIADAQTIALAVTFGGKLFAKPEARTENVGILSTGVQWRARLNERYNLGLGGAYYEAFQSADAASVSSAADQRGDFRSLAPTARLARALGAGADVALSGGYRWLVFKPNPDYTFAGPTGALDLRWVNEDPDAGVDWELGGGVGYERRQFDGHALVKGTCTGATLGLMCPPTPNTVGTTRLDDLYSGHAEITRTGAVLLGLGYVLQWNQSNSIGETLQRHFLSLRLAAALPLGIYVAARGELLIARYADPVVLAAGTGTQSYYPDIDRENRSSLRVELSRTLTDNLQLIARYTVYVNELGDSVGRYHRQTALLCLAFTAEK
ncbi:MAG TPA: hypothetical protein VH374_00335 [Polyangia bacterium]|jgi:hypothetical protein|nr:hypothetical protein [Polyangia bacterium]